jgi:phospholipase D-like protein
MVALVPRSCSDGYRLVSSTGLGYRWQDRSIAEEASVEIMFAGFFVFAIANIVLVIWALVDAIRVPDDSMYRAGNKLIWVLVIILAGFIGAIVYFFVGRPAPGAPSVTGPAQGHLPPPPPGSLG